jgi:glycosyltransferase involved in cell wall biosynthesis
VDAKGASHHAVCLLLAGGMLVSPVERSLLHMAYRLGFVMEQTLGQVTHTQNFQHYAAKDADVLATWILISYEEGDGWASVPVFGRNWTLRASLQARARVRKLLRTQRLDGLLFHTQVTALFAHRLMLAIPTVVSMDATPLNFDSISGPYAHKPSAIKQVESLKNALTRRGFSRARGLIVWHEWGKRSLVEDYGVPPEKVAVIPPGVDLERWNFPRNRASALGPVRLLFVGGDFRRKGGETLLAAMQTGQLSACELDIVTRDYADTRGLPNVRVHRGLGPNAPELLALYGRADIFIFPTLADVLPLAIMEAMASALPVVTTSVGAIGEQIEDGITGFVVPPGDVSRLVETTLRLVNNFELRRTMGDAGRSAAGRLFDESKNYSRVLAFMKRCVDQAGDG